jgi:hypothetical protein
VNYLKAKHGFFSIPTAPLKDNRWPSPRQVADKSKTSLRQVPLFFRISPGSLRPTFGNSSGKIPHFLHCSSGLVRENTPFVRELFGKRSGKRPFLREFFGGGRTVLQALRKECRYRVERGTKLSAFCLPSVFLQSATKVGGLLKVGRML